MDAFKVVLDGLSLWQYYVIDVSQQRKDVRAALELADLEVWSGAAVTQCDIVSLANLVKQEGLIENLNAFSKRFCATVRPRTAASLAKVAFVDINDKDALTEAWIRIVDVLNVDLYEEASQDLKAALEGIQNRVAYTRLNPDGPQLGEISERSVSRNLTATAHPYVSTANLLWKRISHDFQGMKGPPNILMPLSHSQITDGSGMPTLWSTSPSLHPKLIFAER
jgi:hypothetical protein